MVRYIVGSTHNTKHNNYSNVVDARKGAVKWVEDNADGYRIKGNYIYINEVGNPYGIVRKEGDVWIWGRMGKNGHFEWRTFNPRTGRLIQKVTVKFGKKGDVLSIR